MRKLTIPVVAGALILVGMYFFPLGEDVVFKAILDFAGGDYWLARLYQYCIFGALIFVGILLLKFGTSMMTMLGLVAIALISLLVLGVI